MKKNSERIFHSAGRNQRLSLLLFNGDAPESYQFAYDFCSPDINDINAIESPQRELIQSLLNYEQLQQLFPQIKRPKGNNQTQLIEAISALNTGFESNNILTKISVFSDMRENTPDFSFARNSARTKDQFIDYAKPKLKLSGYLQCVDVYYIGHDNFPSWADQSLLKDYWSSLFNQLSQNLNWYQLSGLDLSRQSISQINCNAIE